MHIIIDDHDTDPVAGVWRSFVNGDIDREQLQAMQDTAAIQAGKACERCHVRAPRGIIGGQALCLPCYRTIQRTQR